MSTADQAIQGNNGHQPLVKSRSGDVPNPADFLIKRTADAEQPEQIQLSQEQLDHEIEQLAIKIEALGKNLDEVIVGMQPERRLMIISPLVHRHILLEGTPGLAKTLLCQSFASSLGLSFQRIQFTADLTATDIIGFQRPDRDGEFRFQPGPIFANIVLADEINRAPGKTQSALLQAMQEGEITVDRETYLLPQPFLVLATQNPLEISSATYPLPEAQLDRVGVKSVVAYPGRNESLEIAVRDTGSTIRKVKQLYSTEESVELFRKGQMLARGVQIEPSILARAVDMCRALAPIKGQDAALPEARDGTIAQGPSPRATGTLLRYAQGVALLDGRSHVKVEDIVEVTLPVLRHRIALSDRALDKGTINIDEIILKAQAQILLGKK